MAYTPQGTFEELPPYQNQSDYTLQEYYQALLNTVLTNWFNKDGFYQAQLTNSEVAALLALPLAPAPGTHWYNITIDAMQYINNAGTVKTVTAT